VPTLRDYRERTADELGAWGVVHATAGGTGAYVEVAASPIKSLTLQSKRFEGWYLHRPDASEPSGDRDRRVKVPGGYDPANGRLSPDLAYATNVQIGERVELFRILGGTDLNRAVNEGLKECPCVVETVFAAPPGPTRRLLIGGRGFLHHPRDVLRVGLLSPGSDPAQYDPYKARQRLEVEQNRGSWYLTGRGLPSQGSIYVESVGSFYDACRNSPLDQFGAVSGLSTDTSECEADPEWVAAAALVWAWRHFASVLEPAANARVVRSRGEAAAWFSSCSDRNWERPVRTVRAPAKLWGPSR